MRFESQGKALVRYGAELALGPTYGPARDLRLIAAPRDPTTLKPESTWYLATSLPLSEASPEDVYELYRPRDWIEHYDKPAKHELGWADYQMRPERAIVRHWQLVMLAFTCSLLVGALPEPRPQPARGPATTPGMSAAAARTPDAAAGKKCAPASAGRVVWTAPRMRVRAWLCPWARLQVYWQRWSSTAPPPEWAALLAHVASARPLEAPT